MLLGGIVALLSASVNGPMPRNRAITILGLPIPLLATLTLGIELTGHRALGLVVFTLVVAAGVYGRKFVARFGPRAFTYGVALFVGYLVGFLAGRELPIGQVYWLAAIMWLAAVADIALRALIFDPIARRLLARSGRSFAARARTTIGAAVELLDAPGDTERRRRVHALRLQLVRLNRAALMIDARLTDPQSQLRPGAADEAHERLLELELLIHTIGQLADSLAASKLPVDLEATVRDWLVQLRAGTTAGAAHAVRELCGRPADATPSGLKERTVNQLHALASAIVQAGQAMDGWARLPLAPEAGLSTLSAAGVLGYESPVVLAPTGRLLGSATASRATATDVGNRGLPARLRLGWAGQGSVRLAVAVGAACAAGSALSERRFYWAVIAVFIAFTGANTAGEQISRALQRTLGTIVGIVIGSLLATAIGPTAWSLAVIIPALGVAIYFAQVRYWLTALAITLMVSQLYVQLGEFSSGLLVLRLEETAIGAVIAMLAAVLIFPVGTRAAAQQAATGYFDALASLLGRLPQALLDPPGARRLSADARAVDDALQQLLTTAQPLTWYPTGRGVGARLALMTTTASFARRLAFTADRADTLDERSAHQLREALEEELTSIDNLRSAVRGEHAGTLRPIVDRLARIDRHLAEQGANRTDPRRKMLRAAASLDQRLLELGENFGLATGDDDAQQTQPAARIRAPTPC
jgi:hypothetical protein